MICAKIVVFAQESKNLIIISESIPNLLPPPCPFTSHRLHRSHGLPLWVGNLTDALRYHQRDGSFDGTYFNRLCYS